jgi:hypothetical protein
VGLIFKRHYLPSRPRLTKTSCQGCPVLCFFFWVHSSLSSSRAIHVLMHLPLSLLSPAIVQRPPLSIRRISTTSSTLFRNLPYSSWPSYPSHRYLLLPTSLCIEFPQSIPLMLVMLRSLNNATCGEDNFAPTQ